MLIFIINHIIKFTIIESELAALFFSEKIKIIMEIIKKISHVFVSMVPRNIFREIFSVAKNSSTLERRVGLNQ
jgi:hypothetical protein